MGSKAMITLDAAYEIKYESFNEFKDSLFKDVYDSASFMVREIIDKNEKMQDQWFDRKDQTTQICNVIAFMGQRGSGKSSALSSYCGFLSDFYSIYTGISASNQGEVSADNLELINFGKDKGISFTVLDTIDATLLETDENILEIILGRMLDKLEIREEEVFREDKNAGKNESIRLKTFIGNIYKVMHNKPEKNSVMDEPAVVTVKAMSKSWNLSREFQNLVKQYIDYLHSYGKAREKYARSNYLVIPIDDIDMNAKKCRKMLEMIRKYLMVPRVIILMTSNLEQLTVVCRNHYYKELRPKYMSRQSLDVDEWKELDRLTQEYLEKVIPTGRKVYMPSLYYSEGFIEKNLTVQKLQIEHVKQDAEIGIRELTSALLRLYTGVVCLSGNYENHLLYPISIRKLCNYIKEFRQLWLVPAEGSGIMKAYQHNLNWLYDDVMRRFLFQNVMGSESYFLKEFMDRSADQKISFLAERTLKFADRGTKIEPEIEIKIENERSAWIKDKENNITDCLYLLSLIEDAQIYSKETMICLQLYFTIIMTRLCFESQYGDEKDKEKAEEYWRGNWWKGWEKKILKENGRSFLNEKKETLIEITSFDAKSKKNKNKKDLGTAVMVYQIVRFFVRPEERIDTVSFLGAGDRSVIGLYKAVWVFSLFNLFKAISEFETFFDSVGREIAVQMKRQGVPYDESNFGMKADFEKWYKQYHMRYVAPFFSVEWMNRTLRDVLTVTTEKQSLLEVISNMLDVFEKRLKELDNACMKDKLEESERWNPICVCSYSEVFKECPVIKTIRCNNPAYKSAINRIEEIWKSQIAPGSTGADDSEPS